MGGGVAAWPSQFTNARSLHLSVHCDCLKRSSNIRAF